MTLKKADMLYPVYNHLDVSKIESTHPIDSLLETTKRTLEFGEDVLVSRFGKSCVTDRGERRGEILKLEKISSWIRREM